MNALFAAYLLRDSLLRPAGVRPILQNLPVFATESGVGMDQQIAA